MAVGYEIQGRDAFSATSSTGAINFAALNFGNDAGAVSTGASSIGGLSTPLLIGLAVVAVLLLMKR